MHDSSVVNVMAPSTVCRYMLRSSTRAWGGRVKRGFVERHVMVDTQTMKMVALSVTDESVGDVTEFRSLLGQSMDAIGAKGGASGYSKDPGPDAPAWKRGDDAPPSRIPKPPRVGHPARTS